MDSKNTISKLMELKDSLHPLAGLSSITKFSNGIEEDIKRKGLMSEIIRRLTKLEEDVRKLQAGG